jgi:hypothetical protein
MAFARKKIGHDDGDRRRWRSAAAHEEADMRGVRRGTVPLVNVLEQAP